MNYKKMTNGYLLRFDKDEKFIEKLTEFIEAKKIRTAWLTGLGASKGAEIGYYNLDKQEYQWQTITELTEVVSLTGNITQINNTPSIHIHISLSDKHYKVIGGHLKELVVGGTLEVYLTTFSPMISRRYDDATGLNTLEL